MRPVEEQIGSPASRRRACRRWGELYWFTSGSTDRSCESEANPSIPNVASNGRDALINGLVTMTVRSSPDYQIWQHTEDSW
jgi:hypothetical protein